MSDQHKLELLRFISSDATVGEPARLSFTSVSKSTTIEKKEADQFLTELNKERFITQYAKKGVDGFTVVLTQKGLDAVQDESFI
ncbi:MAG: hypothetical protein ABWZ25_15530 [Chitinophagaceae bacterium]